MKIDFTENEIIDFLTKKDFRIEKIEKNQYHIYDRFPIYTIIH